MIYIIGVNHALQHDGNTPHVGPSFEVLQILRQEFGSYLKEQALSVKAVCIAEEFNEDAIRNSGASSSIAQKITSELGIRHIFCEPSIKKRRSLGITKVSKKEDFLKREKCWLTKLIHNKQIDTIFICGPDHIVSFPSLLHDAEFDFVIVDENYKGEYFK